MPRSLAEMLEASAGPAGDFAEEPVPLTVFVQDSKFLSNPPLSDVQYEAVRYAERVYLPGTYEFLSQSADKAIADYWAEPFRMVNFLTLQWGKGSGKDHCSRIMVLRVAYLMLCLKSPQAYFEMPEQDTIHMLNVATSSGQASRAFFGPLRKAVSRPGNWFQHVAEAVEVSGRRRDPTKALMNLIRFDKNIEAVSGHSDADSQEGLNILLGVADEIDGFRSRAELERAVGVRARESSSSAEAVLEMIRTSASTRFPKTFKNVRISYPRYLGSTIQKLTLEGRQDNDERQELSRHYVSGPLATWDVNPRVHEEDFEEDYRKDAQLARAKYECKPSRAVNPYFANEPALRACTYQLESAYPLEVSDYEPDGRAWKPVYYFSPHLKPIQGARYAMHADLAIKGDRAGIAMAHIKRWDERSSTGTGSVDQDILGAVVERRPVIRVDFVCSFEADPGREPALEIQIRWYRMLVMEMVRRGFNICLASCDGYQSTDTMQLLEAQGIETALFSTDRTDIHWAALKDCAYEGRLEIPRREQTITELLGLSRLPNGKIDHLGDGSKDEADALACSITGAIQLGGEEDPDGSQAYPGGALEDWSGGFLAEADRLPVGFISPSSFRADETMPEPVPLDDSGRLAYWEPGIVEAESEGHGLGHWSPAMRSQR